MSDSEVLGCLIEVIKRTRTQAQEIAELKHLCATLRHVLEERFPEIQFDKIDAAVIDDELRREAEQHECIEKLTQALARLQRQQSS